MFLRITYTMYMYRTPRNSAIPSTRSYTSSPSKESFANLSMNTFVDSIFSNSTVRANINQILRVLFQALIQEFYPYILMTLIFMIISFILLISIFILLVWREKTNH